MRRTIMAILGLVAVAATVRVPAEVAVLAVRLGATDVAALARFYESAFGLKEIDHVGEPPTEIIMRYGTSVAAAKTGSSPEFLVARREAGTASDPMPHAIFRVSDLDKTIAAAKRAGATLKGNATSVRIGAMSVRVAQLVDPDGNVLELMQLPTGSEHLQHP